MAENIERLLMRRIVLTQQILARLWYETQMKESDKTPGLWAVYSGTVPGATSTGVSPNAEAVLSRNPSRSGLTLQNNGTGILLFSSDPFNISEMISRTTSLSGITRIGLLTPGANVSIPTTGAVYAACQTTKGCKISLVETLFKVRQRVEEPGQAGQQWHQYRSVSGEIQQLMQEFV